MRVLFLPMVGTRGLGTVTRLLSLAEQAGELGHEVAFVSDLDPFNWLGVRDYRIFEAPTPRPLNRLASGDALLPDILMVRGLANVEFLRASVAHQVRTIQEYQPDVIISASNFTASIAAQATAVPLVSICCWFEHPDFAASAGVTSPVSSDVCAAYNQILEEFRQPLVNDVSELGFLRSNVKIAPTSPRLEPELVEVPGVTYVGHLLWDRLEIGAADLSWPKYEQTDEQVFVYLSVTEISPQIYVEALAETFATIPYSALVCVGRHPEIHAIPSSLGKVRFVDRVPGMLAMQNSILAIHHGGGNICASSVLAGVPSLILPDSSAERQYNARAMARVRCARVEPQASFAPTRLRTIILEMVGSQECTKAVTEFASHLRELGGPKQAWEIAEGLVT